MDGNPPFSADLGGLALGRVPGHHGAPQLLLCDAENAL